MKTKVKFRLKGLSKVDPKDVWCNLPPGASELVSQLLAAAIGMDEEKAVKASIPIWDQKELKKILRKVVSERFVKKDKSARECMMMMAQFSAMVALNVGSREMLKALVSNMNEDCGELIKEFEAYRESNVGRA